MRHYLVVTGLGLMLLGGCSTTYDIPRESTSPEFLEAIGELEGRTAMVYLFNGQTIKLNSVTLQKDMLFGAIPGSDSLLELPLNEIQTVAVEDYGRGAGRGALQGMAIGGCIALPFALISGAVAHDIGAGSSEVVLPAAVLGIGIASGGLFGAAVGLGAFSTYSYRFRGHQTSAGTIVDYGNGSPRMISIKIFSFQAETPDQVCIMWNGKRVWLPRSEIKIERDGEYIWLTVPEKLLEGE